MGEVSTIGLDLAKNMFQVHGSGGIGRRCRGAVGAWEEPRRGMPQRSTRRDQINQLGNKRFERVELIGT